MVRLIRRVHRFHLCLRRCRFRNRNPIVLWLETDKSGSDRNEGRTSLRRMEAVDRTTFPPLRYLLGYRLPHPCRRHRRAPTEEIDSLQHKNGRQSDLCLPRAGRDIRMVPRFGSSYSHPGLFHLQMDPVQEAWNCMFPTFPSKIFFQPFHYLFRPSKDLPSYDRYYKDHEMPDPEEMALRSTAVVRIPSSSGRNLSE